MKDISDYRHILEQRKGQKEYITRSFEETENKIRCTQRNLRNATDAASIIKIVAQQTQQELEYHVSEPVSLALAAVYDNPYTFKLHFDFRGDKTVAIPYLVRKDKRRKPGTETGGGPMEIAAFALRISTRNLKRCRNIILMDEPFPSLDAPSQLRAGEMLQMIAKKLKVQILMVTHNPTIAKVADKVFGVTMKKGVTEVKEA